MSLDVQPFAFGTEFADTGGQPLDRAALEEECRRLRAAVADAFANGRREGAAEALAALREERDSALLASLETVAVALLDSETRLKAAEVAIARLAADLALDLADHLAGQALERDPAGGVATAVGDLLKARHARCGLRVRIAPGLGDALCARLPQDLALTIVEDEALAPGDARVEWDSGALVLDRQARRAMVAAEVERHFAA